MKIFGRKKSTLSPSELYDKGYSLFVVEGDIQQAVKYFDEAVLNDPVFTAAYVAKGQALAHIGKVQEALSSYDKALKLDPKDVNILLQKAQVLADLDRRDESAECYDRAEKIEPGNV
jgi:tetratricopeptide (TPR) repeat protein